MNFYREWTAFALEAEMDAFGGQRIAEAHNALARTVREQEDQLRTIGEIVGPVPGDDGGNTPAGVVALKMEQVTQERERLNRVIANCEAEIDKQMKLAIARGVEAENLSAELAQAKQQAIEHRAKLEHVAGGILVGMCGHLWKKKDDVKGCPVCASIARLRAGVKGGPCSTCKHRRPEYTCDRTSHDEGGYGATPCDELGGGCYAWEAR